MLKVIGYAFTDNDTMKFREDLEVPNVQEFQKLVEALKIEHYLVILEEV